MVLFTYVIVNEQFSRGSIFAIPRQLAHRLRLVEAKRPSPWVGEKWRSVLALGSRVAVYPLARPSAARPGLSEFLISLPTVFVVDSSFLRCE